MKIKKALIPAAGYGTRFLPITKTIRKEMLPIGNRPVIDYIVEDCLKAGVEEIVFVVNAGDTQIKSYYSENLDFKNYLDKMNKPEKYEIIKDLHTKAKFTFVEQAHGPDDPYGTAVPLKLAREHLQNEEAFIVMMGDDFIYHADGDSEAQIMVEKFLQAGADGLASFIPKPQEELHKYGVASVKSKDGQEYLDKLVEKPEPGTAPSNLANISKYIMPGKIYEALDMQTVNARHNELLITDTVEIFSASHKVLVHHTQGQFLDVGTPESWLQANNIVMGG